MEFDGLDGPALVRAARSGDRDAYGELIRRYSTALYRLAYRLLRSREEAEDACQEAFLRAYTRLDSYNERFAFYTWISTILTNISIRMLQRRDWRSLPFDPELLQEAPVFTEEEPEIVLLAQERADVLRDALTHLPEMYRQMVILRHWHDLSYQEIADLTRQSLATVKVRLHRARHMLAVQLGERQAQGGIA
ncbi:MAG: sigma-70 family RNA polymerase sigma factor [Chloroflexi bacterium]|nr:sigma-70 family RNA polymerase sigma factor [Chloroflexota bacterium]MCL5946722.1 sigma-70 family RNA polymerase sigma factor [Chloroflexota bacterium]